MAAARSTTRGCSRRTSRRCCCSSGNVIDKGGTLSRDVIFVANSDEEQGGDWGMGWLIANHPELIEAEFALNEGGRTRIVGGKRLYVAVQNTEKVPHIGDGDGARAGWSRVDPAGRATRSCGSAARWRRSPSYTRAGAG